MKEASSLIGKKTRQGSRKGTKAWRKNIDISGLEESKAERQKEELSGGLIQDRPDSELFVIDKKGNEEVRRQLRKIPVSRRDQIIAGNPFTKPVGRVGKAPKVESKKKKNTASTSDAAASVVKDTAASADTIKTPWDESYAAAEAKESAVLVKDGFEIITTKKPKVKPPPKILERPSALPAVHVPVTGNSYNPSFEEHQKLLVMAVNEEAEKIRRSSEYAKHIPLEREPTVEIEDMIIPESNTTNAGEDGEELNEAAAAAAAAKKALNARKRKSDRNKELRKKKIEEEEKMAAESKRIRKEINKLDEIEQEIAKLEKAKEERRILNEKKKAEEALKTKRLSRHRYNTPSIPVQLTDEISGSLRSLKPEGNLLTDRFRSLQERNVIEPRVPVSARRRYQLKEVEIHAYKRFQ